MKTSKTRQRLRKKLNKSDEPETQDFMNMFNQVNKMLKENPEMIKKVSKCVNNIFDNKELMNDLVKEINIQDQTLDKSNPVEQVDAVLNESKQ